jgi:hypothetical protein
MSEENIDAQAPEVARVVGAAVQDMAATRLGRAFLPLGLAFLVGLVRMFTGNDGFTLALGAPLSAGAMLAYGLRVVQRAFGKPARPWMVLAVVGGLLPPAFGIYLLGWEGLRVVAEGGGPAAVVAGLFLAGLGVWILRGWIQLLELHRLAETMMMGLPGIENGESGGDPRP